MWGMDWWEKCLGIILVYEDKNCSGFNPFRILLTSGGGFLFHNIVLSATCMIVRIIHRNGAYDASTRYSECNARRSVLTAPPSRAIAMISYCNAVQGARPAPALPHQTRAVLPQPRFPACV